MGDTKRTTKQSIKQRETMENELTTNNKNAFQRFASVFNCFKKKKRKSLEHNERDKTVKFTMSVNDKETVELISEVLNHFHGINTKLGNLMFDDVFEIIPNKRTQSVTQRIHARPRKSGISIVEKHVRPLAKLSKRNSMTKHWPFDHSKYFFKTYTFYGSEPFNTIDSPDND